MTAGGVVSGAVLHAARRTAGLTQEDLAGALGTPVDTVKGWESGRRPLGRVKASRLAQVHRQLVRLGARPGVLSYLNAAVDADEFVVQAVAGDCGLLAGEVMTRAWSCLVGWAATGEPPAEARDVAAGRPLLGARDRAAFFASVREAACQAGAGKADLLRHQAYYLAAGDTSADGITWLAGAARAEQRRSRLAGCWDPAWAVDRSLAVAMARQGDPEPLRWFIRHHLAGPACDQANLTYWAYWIGCDPEPASGEEFMVSRHLGTQQAIRLLQHLVGNLSAGLPYAELSVATICSLLQRWPGLLSYDRQLARDLEARTDAMLGCDWLPADVRRVVARLCQAAYEAQSEDGGATDDAK